ncbi:MAG: hypothetical protein JO213_17085 [Alphaproteobacteria bacterium]|nr:hypothetical protein [Alphaproteobacteria bacterium]MBV9586589.1 hypothetical protein [Alphaproteobacteria bacterium]MBV9966770.1 hypothetical protein [Alphaproteobacteria bacterium]
MLAALNGSAYTLAAAPLVAWWAVAALAAAALLVLALGLWRRAGGVWWRAAAVLMLLAILVNPSLVEEKRSPLRDVAVVVVDESPSQQIGNRAQATEAALASLTERLGHERDLDVRVVRAGKTQPGAADDGTRLFTALGRSMSDIPRQRLAGIVMLTDGQVHDVPSGDVAAAAQELGAPLHVLLSGHPDEGDRRLVVAQAPSFGLVGKEAPLSIRVEDLPEAPKNAPAKPEAQARVTWRKDGSAPQSLMVPVGRDVPLSIPIDHGGPNVLELEVEPGPQELTLANNRAAVVVNGVRDRLRVLLVTGEPHAGERVWRNILKSDPSVDLVHFTILRPPEKQDGTPIRELSLIAFPIRELFDVKLDDFDLIIFDRYSRRGIIPQAYVENVVRYVRKGGAFLEAAGPNFGTPMSLFRTPLGEILPTEPTGNVYEEGFKPQLTDAGRRHPVTEDLSGAGKPGDTPSWGRWFRQIEARVHNGTTVMNGDHGDPLLVLDRVGKGRVAQLLSDEMWLWARGFEGGGPQAELLRRLAYWLMKEPDLEENDLRASVEGDRLVVNRQSLEPDDRPITVTLPDGTTQSLTLSPDHGGRSSGTMPIPQMGLYRASDGTHTALAAAGPLNPVEFADVRATPEKLAPLSQASGGGVFWMGDGTVPEIRRVSAGRAASGHNWMGFRQNGDYVVTGFSELPLMPAIAALLLTIGLLIAAWRREGR